MYVPSSHSVIIADTVEFLPEKILFPQSSTESLLQKTLGDLVHIFKTRQKLNSPQASYRDAVQTALHELAYIFNCQNIVPDVIIPYFQPQNRYKIRGCQKFSPRSHQSITHSQIVNHQVTWFSIVWRIHHLYSQNMVPKNRGWSMIQCAFHSQRYHPCHKIGLWA